MKSHLFILGMIGLLFSQCSPPEAAKPKIDFDQESVKIMNTLAPQLVGQWTLREVQVGYQKYNSNQKDANINRDTVLRNFATLTLRSVSKSRFSPVQPKHAEFEGTIQYQTKTYPIYFYLLANATHIVEKTGPQAFFLFEYNFPVGSHRTEPEEDFLQNIGLINDNFSMEIADGQSTMVWKGLNRGITQINMVKK